MEQPDTDNDAAASTQPQTVRQLIAELTASSPVMMGSRGALMEAEGQGGLGEPEGAIAGEGVGAPPNPLHQQGGKGAVQGTIDEAVPPPRGSGKKPKGSKPLLFATSAGIITVEGSRKPGRASAHQLLFSFQGDGSSDSGWTKPAKLLLKPSGKSLKFKQQGTGVAEASGLLRPLAGSCVVDCASGMLLPHVAMLQGDRRLLIARIRPGEAFEGLASVELPESMMTGNGRKVTLTDGPAVSVQLKGGDLVALYKSWSACCGVGGGGGDRPGSVWQAIRMSAPDGDEQRGGKGGSKGGSP